MEQQLISIIVPVYNVERYLAECVNSICNQTYSNIEIILVDDGSTDKSGEICAEFEKKDTRIRVIHKENGGLSDARNAGINVCRGDYIAFVDSDDYIAMNYIDSLYNAICKYQADIAICDFDYVDESNQAMYDNRTAVQDNIWDVERFWSHYYSNDWIFCVVAWNKLYRRDIFAELRYKYGKTHEDEFCVHHVVAQCKTISIISDKLYYYRQRQNSIMGNNYSVKRMDVVEAYIERCDYFSAIQRYDLIQKTLAIAVDCFFYEAKTKLNMHDNINRERYLVLKNELLKKYFLYKKYFTTKGKLHIGVFLRFESIYWILKGIIR